MKITCKRIIPLILSAGILSVSLVGCGSTGGKTSEPTSDSAAFTQDAVTEKAPSDTGTPSENPDNTDTLGVNTYALNSSTEGIRILGQRYLESPVQINCDWSCSGIEMNIETSGGDVTFTARVSAPSNASCYFRAYVDGSPWNNHDGSVYYTVGTALTPIVLENIPSGLHCIRLIKVTGYTLARAELTKVSFAGTILPDAPAEKELYIEFIGDSICCGWGTIGNFEGAYTDQDGTLAYPYLVASALDADYSVNALSGQGLLKGNPGTYNGYIYASALRSTETVYSFSRKADITVINIGTNDASLQQPESFREQYTALLKEISKQNPGGKIYCIYNTMNDNYSSEILSLCEEAGGEAAGIYTLKFDRAEKEGHPTNHPSEGEHAREAEKLLDYLRQTMNNEVTDVPFAPKSQVGLKIMQSGTGIFLYWKES